MDKNKLKETALGGILNNPVFVLVLGMCPTIGMTTNVTNAIGLGLATTFVLIFSNVFVSLLRKVIPDKVRLPSYIIIIATFVTLVQLFLAKFLPALNASIGKFIPLIVVNCIILGRAEAFAGKNSVGYAAIDGVSMGLGFTCSLIILGGVRMLLILAGMSIFESAAGGFIALGLLMALFNQLMKLYNGRADKKLLNGGAAQ